MAEELDKHQQHETDLRRLLTMRDAMNAADVTCGEEQRAQPCYEYNNELGEKELVGWEPRSVEPFHPLKNMPGCMMPDGGECCAGYTALADDWHKLRNSHADLVKVLEEIAKGQGAFSRDPLTHASNTIDDMKAIANEALATLTARKVG